MFGLKSQDSKGSIVIDAIAQKSDPTFTTTKVIPTFRYTLDEEGLLIQGATSDGTFYDIPIYDSYHKYRVRLSRGEAAALLNFLANNANRLI